MNAMKRYLATIVLMLFMFVSLSSAMCAVAEELEAADSENTEPSADETVDKATDDTEQKMVSNTLEDSLFYACTYDSENRRITVSGTMEHGAFAEYEESTLEIYSVPIGRTEYEVASDPTAEPLATADVSLRFSFTFNVDSYLDKYSRYAVFLRTPAGELLLGTEAQYPEISVSNSGAESTLGFKGIVDTGSYETASVDAGTVIIPIYLDSMFTEDSGGYIYRIEHSHLFFAKKYIDELDAKINSYSISGARVYLQLLLRDGNGFGVNANEETETYLPNVYDEDTIFHIHSAVDFLTERYSTDRGGRIFGYIIGDSWDEYLKYNYIAHDSFEEYAEMCGFYTILVANAARSVNSSIDIVLPVSANTFKAEEGYEGSEGHSYPAKAIIETVLGYFDRSFSTGVSCSLLVSSSETPFGITNESIELGIDTEYDSYNCEIYAGNTAEFSKYLKTLSERYEEISDKYMFLWRSPQELGGNALSAAYEYSYYALLCDTGIKSFVAKISTEKLTEIHNTFKYINTAGNEITILEYFDVSSWTELPGITSVSPLHQCKIYTAMPTFKAPENIIGSFKYFDFSDTVLVDGWYKGIGCKNIGIEYDSSQHKALFAKMNTVGGRSEMIYDYERYENISYTPYIEFELELEDTDSESVYEVFFALEDTAARIESSFIANANERISVIFDVSEYAAAHNLENLKISVRKLFGESESYTLWLYEITGHSAEISSEELAELIDAERDKIRHIDDEDISGQTLSNMIIVGVVVVVTGALGVGIFMLARRGSKTGRKDE